jgi:hypothetical protein
MQEQTPGKAVPKGVAANLERRPSPHVFDLPIDVRADCLAGNRKYPFVLPKLPHPVVALDPSLEVPVEDRDEAFGVALGAAFTWSTYPLA